MVAPREWPNVLCSMPQVPTSGRTVIMGRWKPNFAALHGERSHKTWIARHFLGTVDEWWSFIIRGQCLAQRGTTCHTRPLLHKKKVYRVVKHDGSLNDVEGEMNIVLLGIMQDDDGDAAGVSSCDDNLF